MFDSIRSHRRWLMIFVLVLIVPSFVFFGLQGYSRFIEQEGALAKVDGQPIMQQEFDAAQRDRSEQLRRNFGADFDSRMLETPEARASILDGLIIERALTSEANRANIVVTNDKLRDVIASVPAFQEQGQFDYERYRAFLMSQGYTEPMFEQRVRTDLRRQAIPQALVESAIVPAAVTQRLERLLLEQRQVRELLLPAEDFVPKVTISDEQIQQYYNDNRSAFEIPESVKIEYVALSADDLASGAELADAELRAYYEQNKARFGAPEQRRASHILITAEGGDKAAARKRAEDLLARIKANPADFAKLAREASQDPGSAANGGDLGFFSRGMMVKPFEETVFSLQAGETSGVVETDFGFHIIRLDEVQPAQAKPFEEVRAEIESDLRGQQAQRRFAEAAEQFTNLVYEQSDSLKPVADKFGLKIRPVDGLTRKGLPPHISSRVVDAIFSDDALRQRRNTPAIEVGASTLVSARVVEHRPSTVKPLEEVRDQIRRVLVQREAVRLAREAGEARLAQLRQQPSTTGFSPPKTVSRAQSEEIPPSALNAVMQVPADKLPAFVGAEVEGTGYMLVQVLSATAGADLQAAQREAQQRVLVQQSAGADETAYAEGLKRRFDARVLKPEFRREPKAAPATGK